MSEMYRCRGCGAIYSPVQDDGSLYQHACAPLPAPDFWPAPARKGHRDENVRLNRRGKLAGLVAEGAGVDPVTPEADAEPRWIRQYKADLAAQEGQ